MNFTILGIILASLLCSAFTEGETGGVLENTDQEYSNEETLNAEGTDSLRKKCFIPTAENRQKQISVKLSRAEIEQRSKTLQLALTTTKLSELEKQRDAEKISDSTPRNKLTRLQRTILDDIAKTKAEKEDQTVELAVFKTLIEQLKVVLVANGGSTTTSSTAATTALQNQLSRQITRVKANQQRAATELINVESQLERLYIQESVQNINTDNGIANLPVAQRLLLLQIERTKEKKYQLTLQSALATTMIELLQLQLQEISSSSNIPENTGSNGSSQSTSSTTNTSNGSSSTVNIGTESSSSGSSSTDSSSAVSS